MQKSRGGPNSCSEEKKKKKTSPHFPAAAIPPAVQLKKNTSASQHPISIISSSSIHTDVERKKRLARVSELESQVAHLQQDLNKAKDQLRSSEAGRREALQEAEEAKRRVSFMAEKLEESKQQLMDLSNSEDDRVQQLRKLSQERDRAWQSELEAVQTHKAMDAAALASAMNEIKKLRVQLGRAAESEAMQSKHAESAHHDVHTLRMELSETLNLVETLRNELADCRESEAQAMEVIRNTERQVEIANVTADTLRSELERSRDQIKDKSFQSCFSVSPTVEGRSVGRDDDDDELNCVKVEASKLRCALEEAETRYQEEYIQSTLQIRSAYEQVERVKRESCQKQTALEEKLKVASSRIEQLTSKDTEIAEEMEKLRSDLSELKENLRDKERKLQLLSEENEGMRQEILSKRDVDDQCGSGKAASALTKEEKEDESNKRTIEITQQLDAAQAANSEMESELRRLKVQSEQWRKAAEVATSMLPNTTTGKLVGGSSVDTRYYSSITTMGSSSPNDSTEDDSPKKKNMMLKKIGVLWKKGQNK